MLDERHFSTAIDAILKNWSALQLVLSHAGGTINAAQFNAWFTQSVMQWFKENEDLDAQEVEGFLEDIVVTEFNVEIEDDSYPEVAGLICRFFQICSSSSQSEEQILAQLRTLPKCDLSLCRSVDVEGQQQQQQQQALVNGLAAMGMESVAESTTESTESRTTTVQNGPPEPDEDGFVTVASRRKRR